MIEAKIASAAKMPSVFRVLKVKILLEIIWGNKFRLMKDYIQETLTEFFYQKTSTGEPVQLIPSHDVDSIQSFGFNTRSEFSVFESSGASFLIIIPLIK
jgi:hypothetical protein